MKTVARILLLLVLIFVVCMQVAPGASAATNTSNSIIGTWEGTYSGHTNGTIIERGITIEIDSVQDGVAEGIASIDQGTNGKYIFKGNLDASTGAFSFSGTEWIDNSANFSFVNFKGSVDFVNGTYEGLVNEAADRPFSLHKVSNQVSYTKLDLNTVPRKWVGEYDGYNSSNVLKLPT